MKQEAYSPEEIKRRFAAILRGAMHKPAPHKDVPKKRGRKAKPRPSRKETSE